MNEKSSLGEKTNIFFVLGVERTRFDGKDARAIDTRGIVVKTLIDLGIFLSSSS